MTEGILSPTPSVIIGMSDDELEGTYEYFESATKDAYGTAVVPITIGERLMKISPIQMGESKSETITFRIPQAMHYHMSLLVAKGECPYDRVSELARDGAILLSRYIVNQLRFRDAGLYSYFEGVMAQARARYVAEFQEKLIKFAHALRDTVLDMIADEDYDAAAEFMILNWNAAINTPEERHRKKYTSVFSAYPSVRLALRLCMEHGLAFPPELVAVVQEKVKPETTTEPEDKPADAA